MAAAGHRTVLLIAVVTVGATIGVTLASASVSEVCFVLADSVFCCGSWD